MNEHRTSHQPRHSVGQVFCFMLNVDRFIDHLIANARIQTKTTHIAFGNLETSSVFLRDKNRASQFELSSRTRNTPLRHHTNHVYFLA